MRRFAVCSSASLLCPTLLVAVHGDAVWLELEQQRWTQPSWRPADWVQIPAPAWQPVAFETSANPLITGQMIIFKEEHLRVG